MAANLEYMASRVYLQPRIPQGLARERWAGRTRAAIVTPSGTGAVTTQLTLSTSTETGALRWNSHSLFPAAPLTLAVGLLWLGKRRRLWMVVLLAMAFAGSGMLTACGGGSSSTPPASKAPVTSTVTVNATSGSIQQAATVTLTVN